MTKEDMLDELLRGLLAEGWLDSRTAIPEDAAQVIQDLFDRMPKR